MYKVGTGVDIQVFTAEYLAVCMRACVCDEALAQIFTNRECNLLTVHQGTDSREIHVQCLASRLGI